MTSRHRAAWRLALPMYNTTPVVDLWWQQLLHAVMGGLRGRGWEEDLRIEPEPGELIAFWRSPDLLLSQTCGYPLMTELGDQVRVLAAPVFDWPGCEGSRHCSYVVVRDDGEVRTLEDLRGARAAINQPHSNSGMNALRHVFAPLSREGRFFGSVQQSGGHLASLRLLQQGAADVASVDNVSWGLAARHAPERTAGLRVLAVGPSVPGLPLVCSRELGDEQAEALSQLLFTLMEREGELAQRLGLRAFVPARREDYEAVLVLRDEAVALGYPEVA